MLSVFIYPRWYLKNGRALGVCSSILIRLNVFTEIFRHAALASPLKLTFLDLSLIFSLILSLITIISILALLAAPEHTRSDCTRERTPKSKKRSRGVPLIPRIKRVVVIVHVKSVLGLLFSLLLLQVALLFAYTAFRRLLSICLSRTACVSKRRRAPHPIERDSGLSFYVASALQ